VSPRSTGRHRKTRLPWRRTLSVASGAATASLVVAVTTGAVHLPSVAPGQAHESGARGAQTAEPVSLYVASGAASKAGGPAGSNSAARELRPASRASDSGPSAEPTATAAPTNAAEPSAYAAPRLSSSASSSPAPSPSGGSPTPSDGSPAPGLPVPLPTVTSLPSVPSVPSVPSLPAIPPASNLPLPLP
jgi:hypothetical protein